MSAWSAQPAVPTIGTPCHAACHVGNPCFSVRIPCIRWRSPGWEPSPFCIYIRLLVSAPLCFMWDLVFRRHFPVGVKCLLLEPAVTLYPDVIPSLISAKSCNCGASCSSLHFKGRIHNTHTHTHTVRLNERERERERERDGKRHGGSDNGMETSASVVSIGLTTHWDRQWERTS